MNKAVVALSIAAALTGLSANAGTLYKKDNGDYLKVYGGAEVGGTFIIDDDKKATQQPPTKVGGLVLWTESPDTGQRPVVVNFQF